MSKTPLKRGRPAGMRARQLELKQTLLEHPDVPTVIETVVRTALDDTHKNQTAAQRNIRKSGAGCNTKLKALK